MVWGWTSTKRRVSVEPDHFFKKGMSSLSSQGCIIQGWEQSESRTWCLSRRTVAEISQTSLRFSSWARRSHPTLSASLFTRRAAYFLFKTGMSHEFHFLDDVATADLAFDAVGDSLQDLFQGATNALIETLADPQTVRPSWQQAIARTDEDPAVLLFDWLSDLVYWKDAAGVVFSKAHVALTHRPDGAW